MNSYDRHGKVAVITGGAQGIGLPVAQRLQASGATALLWDRDGDMAAASAAGFGGRAHGAAVDVRRLGRPQCHGRYPLLYFSSISQVGGIG